MKIPLTISLLASSRINSLERCLDSLKPLLLKVPAELIVVFTGTDEKVRDLAARYTDQIIPFAWCNDFSAARNAGLKRARGEWFMYIDDDEWFEDVTEICEFFTSGEYRKYGYAFYGQRNYTDWSGIKCTDFSAFRMAKRVPELHFENPIHEEMFPYREPFKVFRSYVHHYGYIRDTARESDKKTSRNIPLLLEDIRKRPFYLKNYVQLTQEYLAKRDWEKAEEYCREGRKICRKDKGDPAYERWLQSHLVETLYLKGEDRQAEAEAADILDKEKPCELVSLLLYSILVVLCQKRKASEEALRYGQEFERLLIRMDKRPGLWEDQMYGDLNEDKVKNPDRLHPVRLACAEAALDLGDDSQAERFLKLLPWKEEYMIRQHYPLLDQWKETYGSRVLRLYAGLDFDSPYLLLQRLFYGELVSKEETETLFLRRRCLQEIEQPYLQRQLVERALREQYAFSELLNRMDLDSWRACIGEILKDTPYGENVRLWEARRTLFSDHPLQGLWMEALLLERDLSRGFLMKKELLAALKRYGECVTEFYRGQYREELFSEKSCHLLPVDCRQALVLLKALEKLGEGYPAEAVRLFGTALQIYPKSTGVIREILRLLTHEEENPAQTAGAEFQGLAVQMKGMLRGMMDQGQYREAMSVLPQLLSLLPEDLELVKLHQQLLERLAE